MMLVRKTLTTKKQLRQRQRLIHIFGSSSLIWFVLLCWLCCSTCAPPRGSESICAASSKAFAYAAFIDNASEERKNVMADDSQSSIRTQYTDKASLNQILIRAGRRGLGGGIPGALAGMVQVITLMWLRTLSNYQCRYGTTFSQALVTLLREGGVSRLYRGLSFALMQAPLARFVSTAANDGVDVLMDGFSWTRNWGPGRKTIVASMFVGLWRMVLMRKSVISAFFSRLLLIVSIAAPIA